MLEMKMRRLFFSGLLVLAVALVLPGCQLLNRVPKPSLHNPLKRGGKKSEVPKNVKLTYWGLWEPEEVMRPVIEQYQKLYSQKNPGSTISIDYIRKPPSQYRETLQSSIRSGGGPDIFRFHNTWVPMLREELAPLPQTIMNNSDYEAMFYPVTKSDLLVGNSYVGIPLMVDGLALFYNEDIFRGAGLSTPPTSWDELRTLAQKLTKTDPGTGEIVTAGIALGTANNVHHFSDIIGLMMLQNQADLRDLTDTLAQDAFRFYTIFSVEDKVWNETLPPSTESFAAGRVAMMLAPSWRVANIREANPQLQFRTAPVPQLPGSTVNWASYWVEGVSSRSPFQAEAWDFLKFLSEKETLRRLYTDAAKTPNRLFGEPYPRRDMADSLLNEPFVGPYIQAAPTAQSWYFASRTFDNGINDRLIKALEDAVNAVNQGAPYANDQAYVGAVKQALSQAQQNAANILTQYNIQVPTSPQ
jgi:multiple sugar transport system substrate-binding protein